MKNAQKMKIFGEKIADFGHFCWKNRKFCTILVPRTDLDLACALPLTNLGGGYTCISGGHYIELKGSEILLQKMEQEIFAPLFVKEIFLKIKILP